MSNKKIVLLCAVIALSALYMLRKAQASTSGGSTTPQGQSGPIVGGEITPSAAPGGW